MEQRMLRFALALLWIGAGFVLLLTIMSLAMIY